MQPRKRGKPPTLQRKNRGRQNQTAQMRQRQLQQHLAREQQQFQQSENVQNDEPPGFSFDTPGDPSANAIWVPEPGAQGSAPMTSVEMQGMNDTGNPFWRPKRAQLSEKAVVSSTSQLHVQNQNQLATSPDHVQQPHQLHQSWSPAGVHILPESTAIKQELQEIEQRRRQSGQYQQHPSHSPQMSVPHHPQSQQQTRGISQALSTAEQRQWLHLQNHLSNQGGNTGQHHQVSPQQQLAGDHRPRSPHVPQSIANNNWSGTHNLALPHTLAEAPHASSEPVSSSQQQVRARVQTAMYGAYSDESVEDKDMYVRKASEIADDAKLEHRALLKEAQRSKEMEAETRGEPLSAKDKERERSRRESAVTRKRAEIYIQELERTARKVPLLEKTISNLLDEFERLGGAPPHGRKHPLAQLPVASAMSAVQCSEGVKAEPGLMGSLNTTEATKVLGELKYLDL